MIVGQSEDIHTQIRQRARQRIRRVERGIAGKAALFSREDGFEVPRNENDTFSVFKKGLHSAELWGEVPFAAGPPRAFELLFVGHDVPHEEQPEFFPLPLFRRLLRGRAGREQKRQSQAPQKLPDSASHIQNSLTAVPVIVH